MIAILKEHLTFLFHFSVAVRVSIKDKSIKSPTITALQFWGRPVIVVILGKIMAVNIKIPLINTNHYLEI
ncbi:MAG: hypothetical protein ABFC34_07040 [Methanobacterium sp.]|jgi:hypothetical protein